MSKTVKDSDPIREVLTSLRLSASRLSQCEFRAPWGIVSKPFAPAFVFSVMEGRFLFEAEGMAPIWVETGDLLLLTRPLAHIIRSDAEAPLVPLDAVWAGRGHPTWPEDKSGERIIHVTLGDTGPVTRLVGMVIEVESGWGKAFLEHLSPAMRIDGRAASVSTWLRAFIDTLDSREMESSPGRVAILLRLAEIVFISALSAHLRDSGAVGGWVRALLDPNLSRAVIAVQRRPGHAWTIPDLAREARMSRSVFCLRFKDVTGSSPHGFVNSWRMRVAADLLARGDHSAKQASQKLGYSSPSVFGAAFHKHFGLSPAQFGKRHGPTRLE